MSEKKLMDRFGRVHDYVRISITDRCNLRCVYCMPEEGLPFFPHEDVLSQGEIVQTVANLAKMGIKKVRLTGGEPLLRKDVVEIVQHIKEIPEIEDLAVTTNGLALHRLAPQLKKAGLDRLNISLDTFDAQRYRTITRGGNVNQVLRGIQTAGEQGFKKIKLNVVVIKGQNDDEVEDFLAYTLDHDVTVRFIEFMPIGQEDSSSWQKSYFQLEQIFEICQAKKWSYSRIEETQDNGPAENFKIEGAKGNFGLIHPVSCRFCESCNRLRITADGCIKSCLYWDDEENIRSAINDFPAFEAKIMASLRLKPENHEMALTNQHEVKDKKPTWRHMSQIGG